MAKVSSDRNETPYASYSNKDWRRLTDEYVRWWEARYRDGASLNKMWHGSDVNLTLQQFREAAFELLGEDVVEEHFHWHQALPIQFMVSQQWHHAGMMQAFYSMSNDHEGRSLESWLLVDFEKYATYRGNNDRTNLDELDDAMEAFRLFLYERCTATDDGGKGES